MNKTEISEIILGDKVYKLIEPVYVFHSEGFECAFDVIKELDTRYALELNRFNRLTNDDIDALISACRKQYSGLYKLEGAISDDKWIYDTYDYWDAIIEKLEALKKSK